MCINSVTFKKKSQKIVLMQEYNDPVFRAFLVNINAIFANDGAEILKNGDTTTVVKMAWKNKFLIIKRYNNMGGKLNAIKRYFLSRAKRSWLCAHRLLAYEINTAKPVAYVEEGSGKHKTSFFITEYIDGISAGHFFENIESISPETNSAAVAVIDLINHLFRMPISHGDLKASNIILGGNKAYFIDLDGTQRHFSKMRQRYRQRRDKMRFLKNWLSKPNLYNYFSEKLTTTS